MAAMMFFALAGRAAAQAVVVEVRGAVEILFSGAPGWKAAEEGMGIEADTVISTGFRSTALIQTGSSRILLRPVTRLTLEELILRGGTEVIGLSLRAGRIRVDVSAPRESATEFSVRSPMAVASVRGTSFEFDTVNVSVDRGLVRYAYINGLAVYVAGREASYAEDPARRVVPPQELAAADRVPRIPLYTGLEEPPAAPRYPGAGLPGAGAPPPGPPDSGGDPPGGATGITLTPGWIP
jgi:hypothetical protein